MEINEKILKITGGICIEDAVEHGEAVEVTIKYKDKKYVYEAPLVTKQENNNQDGTLDMIYKCKFALLKEEN